MFPQQPLPSENFTLLMKYIQFFRCYKYLTFRNFPNMPLKEGETNTTKPSSYPTTQRTTTVVAEWFSRKKVQGEKKVKHFKC